MKKVLVWKNGKNTAGEGKLIAVCREKEDREEELNDEE